MFSRCLVALGLFRPQLILKKVEIVARVLLHSLVTLGSNDSQLEAQMIHSLKHALGMEEETAGTPANSNECL